MPEPPLELRSGRAASLANSAGVPGNQTVKEAHDVDELIYFEDMAAVDVHVNDLDLLPLKNDTRVDDRRTKRLLKQIRWFGYNSAEPVIVRIGRRGRWVVVDGGHRLTAARRVAKEFWPNLFGAKVQTISFLVFRTPLSNTRSDDQNIDPVSPTDQ